MKTYKKEKSFDAATKLKEMNSPISLNSQLANAERCFSTLNSQLSTLNSRHAS